MSNHWYSIPHLSRKALEAVSGSDLERYVTKIPEASNLLLRCDFEGFPAIEGDVDRSFQEVSMYPREGPEALLAVKLLNRSLKVTDSLNKAFPEESLEDVDEMELRKRAKDNIWKGNRISAIAFSIASAALSLAQASVRGTSSVTNVEDNVAHEVIMKLVLRGKVGVVCLNTGTDPLDDAGPTLGTNTATTSIPAYGTNLTVGMSSALSRNVTSSANPDERAGGNTDAGEGADTCGNTGASPVTSFEATTLEPARGRCFLPDILVCKKRMLNKGGPLGAVVLERPALDLKECFPDTDVATSIRLMMEERTTVDLRTPILLAVSRGILYSLHTESGIVLLTDCNNIIFLGTYFAPEIRPQPHTARLKVMVSKLYTGDRILAGYIAFLRYLVTRRNPAPNWDFNARFCKSLRQGNALHLVGSLAKPNIPDGLATAAHVSALSAGAGGLTQSSTAQGGASSSLLRGRDTASSSVPPNLLRCADVPVLRNEDLYNLIDYGSNCFENRNEFVVLRSTLEQTLVVVKYAELLGDTYAERLLNHELNLHLRLHQETDGDYGAFFSVLMGYGFLAEYGLVLVTKFVGYGVKRDKQTILVNGEPVRYVSGLARAAVKSLRRLHACGVLQQDIALHNLRASHCNESDWQVWWLDLGMGHTAITNELMLGEEELCMRLFVP